MFSIKQFVLNMSSEARKELRELIDMIEGASVVKETPPVKNKAKAVEADAPTEE